MSYRNSRCLVCGKPDEDTSMAYRGQGACCELHLTVVRVANGWMKDISLLPLYKSMQVGIALRFGHGPVSPEWEWGQVDQAPHDIHIVPRHPDARLGVRCRQCGGLARPSIARERWEYLYGAQQ